MHGDGRDHAVITELAEEIHAGWLGEIIGRTRLVITVGVNDWQPFAGENVGMGQRPVTGKEIIVIVAHHIADALRGRAEAAVVWLVIALEAAANAVPHPIQDIVIGDAHAPREIRPFRRRRSEMLAEKHRIVTGLILRIKQGVAMVVPIAEAAADIELFLNLAVIAPVYEVLVRAVLLAEESRWHVFHRVQAEAVGLGFLDEPAHGAEHHLVHVFARGIAHIILPIGMSPRGGPAGGDGRIDSGIGEGFRCLPHVVLPIRINVLEIEAPVPRADGYCAVEIARVLERLLVTEGMERSAHAVGAYG